METLERYRGSLLGLATGDALGTTLEFSPPGSVQPLDDMMGGEPFELKPGQWTDDTSMALCLAESLIESLGFDPVDQMERYVRWFLAALLVGAVRGASKEELLSDHYAPAPGLWDAAPLSPRIAEVAAGSFRRRDPPEIRGTGYVVQSLEAALWAFDRSTSFRAGALMAVNLGEDADTTGAVYGQLAGADYGESAIPPEWRRRLAMRDVIESYAEQIHRLAS